MERQRQVQFRSTCSTLTLLPQAQGGALWDGAAGFTGLPALTLPHRLTRSLAHSFRSLPVNIPVLHSSIILHRTIITGLLMRGQRQDRKHPSAGRGAGVGEQLGTLARLEHSLPPASGRSAAALARLLVLRAGVNEVHLVQGQSPVRLRDRPDNSKQNQSFQNRNRLVNLSRCDYCI